MAVSSPWPFDTLSGWYFPKAAGPESGSIITKFPLNLSETLTSLVLAISLGLLFFNYAPWLLASKPLEELPNYELENPSPPEDAQSFAINHGRAIYFTDGVPKERPAKTSAILGMMFALWIGLIWISIRARKRRRSPAIE